MTPQISLLSVGTDRNLFKKESAVRKRIFEYGTLFTEMHIIVFTARGYKKEHIAPNIWLYPTNSFSRWWYVFDSTMIARRLRAKKVAPDIVTAQDPFESGLAAFFAAKIFRTPLHLQVHTDLFNPFFTKHPLLNAFRVRIARFLLPRASGIRVVSERIKDSILKKFSRRSISDITVLPIFVDAKVLHAATADFNLHEKYPRFSLIALVIARLEPEKNVSFAIELLRHAVQNGAKDVGLVIVGDGREREKLQHQAKEAGLAERVVFEGQASDLASYYKTADILLIPSHYEGYGMVIAEAFFSGLPVLSFDVGAAPQILAYKKEMICPPEGEACMKQKFLKWATDSVFRQELLEQAQSEAGVSEGINKEQYLTEYRRALSVAIQHDKRSST